MNSKNEVITTILNRRSIRKFNNQKINDDDLKILAECAIHAPSGMSKDLWYFAVINNQGLIDELVSIMKRLLDNDKYDMYCPKALIISANKKDNSHGIEDNACALENIFIAARSMNIGSVWINQVRHYMEDEELRAYLLRVGIDESMNVYGVAALGYYDEEPNIKKRLGKYNIYS